MVTALRNSLLLTVASVTIIVFLSRDGRLRAPAAAGPGRRRSSTALMLAGLDHPAGRRPTIFVLQAIGLFKTLPGLILVEVAFLMPFSVLVFRTFVSAIPRELDEAAIMDGATPVDAVPERDPPAPAAGHHHGDRRLVGRRLQRLRQPAVLPARRPTTRRSS